MNLVEKLKSLPHNPGVYLMKNSQGNIIYIGKAKDLKNRVNQYFQKNVKSLKTINLVKNIVNFDTILCASELDALCLEASLIKKHQPFYNILLKDGKAYPYIRLDINEPFAVPTVVRKLSKDNAKYYGPFMLGVSASEIIEIIQYAFSIRFCKGKLKSQKRECLNYNLKLCSAPCTGRISQQDYKLILKEVEKFLNGDTQIVEKILQAKMQLFANNEQFETAIKYREQLKALQRLNHKYTVEFDNFMNADILGLYTEGDVVALNILIYRNGKLMGKDAYLFSNNENESVLQFLCQFYSQDNVIIPENIYTNLGYFDIQLFQEMLSKISNKKIEVKVAQKGKFKKLTDISISNAKEHLEKNLTMEKLYEERTTGALVALKNILDLKNVPYRIEGYDISNISGVDKVASMVVFKNGEITKNYYRKFKIKTIEGANDFASLNETLKRRLENMNGTDESFKEVPDLILIDGGLGQLNAVAELVNSYNKNIEVISIAKKEELIYTQYSNVPFKIERSNYSLQLLQRVRDESHRFAITFFKSLHNKRNIESILDDIQGIGKAKKQALLKHFKTINAIKNATIEEISAVKGMSKQLAQNVLDKLNKTE